MMKFKKIMSFALLLVSPLSYSDNIHYKNLLALHSQYEKGLKIYKDNQTIESNGIGYLIKDSNIVFDCHNAVIDGGGKVSTGLLIESYGQDIHNITIKNCTFKNFKYNGIRIGWGIPDVLKNTIPKQERYNFHPNKITIDNVKIENSGTVGLYIDDYVSNVVVKNSMISNSGAPAIYLEFSSRNNTIDNNVFVNNGYNKKRGSREAISVDGSYSNLITKNIFKNNALGGIFLYKNCQEQSSKGNAPIRLDGADYNNISENNFINEKIGIWIASRQSKDLSKWDCGDKPMYSNKYYQDYADHNKLIKNYFHNVSKGIIVEGDYNIIEKNNFDKKDNSIIFPYTKRALYLNKPQVGNIVE
ncbi:right-handed parallel beta-helix repeat-containing protein [Acinetobacter sp. ME22]|uniref:right-handed parallel beta-helix repeat-containing protein n=1 Tax=Acinetobacter sp. ME22 TaxID=2904802 RepID=UPI001EDB909D|nr:right-handed parallel beta-helix repeat-containing protein [Acinetobacter sp. ME22]MCG2574277.1 right-handed parallel beta-helix repeat-containing protein [Acinetobacter sp. ME22]